MGILEDFYFFAGKILEDFDSIVKFSIKTFETND